MTDIEQTMNDHGFELQETGGGCTAYVSTWMNGFESIITKADDPVAPESLNEPICYAFYDEHGNQVMTRNFHSITEYIDCYMNA